MGCSPEGLIPTSTLPEKKCRATHKYRNRLYNMQQVRITCSRSGLAVQTPDRVKLNVLGRLGKKTNVSIWHHMPGHLAQTLGLICHAKRFAGFGIHDRRWKEVEIFLTN